MITFAAGEINAMKYDFDEQIDRRGTGAYKLEQREAVFGTADVQPLWVADMDFRTPDFILDAIRHRLEHPVLGYTVTPPAYYDCVVRWVRDRHGWDIRPEWMGFLALSAFPARAGKERPPRGVQPFARGGWALRDGFR